MNVLDELQRLVLIAEVMVELARVPGRVGVTRWETHHFLLWNQMFGCSLSGLDKLRKLLGSGSGSELMFVTSKGDKARQWGNANTIWIEPKEMEANHLNNFTSSVGGVPG